MEASQRSGEVVVAGDGGVAVLETPDHRMGSFGGSKFDPER